MIVHSPFCFYIEQSNNQYIYRSVINFLRMICSFYSHETGFDKIVNIVTGILSKGKPAFSKDGESDVLEMEIKGGLFSSASSLRIQYRQKETPSWKFEPNDNSPITNNLRGLYGFVAQLPSSNEQVKNFFLQKITTLNSEFSLSHKGNIKELDAVIRALAAEFDAIVFAQPGTLISQAKAQHFLNRDLKLILDQEGNCHIDALQVNIKSVYFDADQQSLTADQQERKARNIELVKAAGINVITHLPCVESEADTTLRTAKEIAQRVSILAVTNMVAFDNISGEAAISFLQRDGLWDYVTPAEKEFLANPTEDRKMYETWKCEAIWTLLWAVNKVDNLPFPNDLCQLKLVPEGNFPTRDFDNLNDFIASVNSVRSKSEILDANDLYYRLHWACVDARIKGQEMTALQPGVVYERQYALNWLVRYMDQDWDDVTCDT